ncbi:MAG: L-lactate permease [Burkholderiales bacterium]|nr:L-lactate permease [Burkholderiales bacterium]
MINFINIFIDLSPIIICGILIAAFKKPAWQSGIAGVIIALLIAQYKMHYAFDYNNISNIFKSSIILSLSAFIVILPGLYLNNILTNNKTIDGIVNLVSSFKMSNEIKVILLLLGILPALESLTGFGVSLFIGVPIFFKMFENTKAFKLSALGMSIMPWGTLGLSLIIGAKLSGYDVNSLAKHSAIFSITIFPVIGLIGLFVIGKFKTLKKFSLVAILSGLFLGAMLYIMASINMVEISGIVAGLSVAIIVGLLFKQKLETTIDNNIQKSIKLLYPYLLILGLICTCKFVTPLNNFMYNLLILKSNNLSFSVFNSPGIILALVAIILRIIHPIKLNHKMIIKRGYISGLSLFIFILISQIMNQSGIINNMVEIILSINNHYIIIMIMPFLAIMASFITGSAVSSNALLIQIQQQIGNNIGDGIIFTAMQNSTGGHAAMFSLSIIIMINMIARDYIKQDTGQKINYESILLKFNIKCMCLVYLILVSNLFIQYCWR